MATRSLTEAQEETRTASKVKTQKAKSQAATRKPSAEHFHTVAKRKTQKSPAATHSTSKESSEPSPIRLAKLRFQPIEKIQALPEYEAAGLKESDTTKYLPSLSINTVEEFLGLIRGVTRELAEDLGTTEDKLVDLYNAAVASQLPALSPQTMDSLLEEEYSFGSSLEAPPSETASLGVSPDIEMDMSASESLSAELSALKATVNLIDQHMPPIRDQGKRGTCVAFSTCAVMEYMTSRANKPNQNFSEQYLYWVVKKFDGYPKDGTWLTFSFPIAKEGGTCKESLWPYEPDSIPNDLTHGHPPDELACKTDALTNALARAIRIREYRRPESIKAQLAQGRPVAIAIPVFKSWYDDPASRLSGNIHLPLKSDRFALSGHAIVLVGYGDDESEPGGGYFIVRNSWGGRWGRESPFSAGYGYISYAYIERFNADAWTGVI